MDKACSPDGKDEKYISSFTREPEVNGLLKISRLRWEDNIKLDPKQLICNNVVWIQMAQDRTKQHALVNMVTNFWVVIREKEFHD
jgi:hypothetical protein